MYNTEISPLKTNVMRLKTPKPIRLIALAGIALFIGSCAKNTTIIYGSGEDDSLPETLKRVQRWSPSMLLSKAVI